MWAAGPWPWGAASRGGSMMISPLTLPFRSHAHTGAISQSSLSTHPIILLSQVPSLLSLSHTSVKFTGKLSSSSPPSAGTEPEAGRPLRPRMPGPLPVPSLRGSQRFASEFVAVSWSPSPSLSPMSDTGTGIMILPGTHSHGHHRVKMNRGIARCSS
jgi:hypothetical protein